MIPLVSAEQFGQLPPVAASPVAMSPDFVDWPYLAGIVDKLPGNFVAPIAERYRNSYQKAGQQAANQWIGGIGRSVTVRGAELAASDSEICSLAKSCADQVGKILASTVGTTAESLESVLTAFCLENGAVVPEYNTLRGLISRLTDPGFWRRQFRRTVARQVEGFARDMGMVSRKAGIYASDETVKRHGEQQRRNAAALEATEAVNSEGEAFNLAELAALGVSNPSVRFAELMVRVKGMESHARDSGYIGLFVTGTAPSCMHAVKKDGRQNALFEHIDPRAAQQWLARQWGRMRTEIGRAGIKYYGVRVAEPHHDGTPHWHMLVFIQGRSAVGRFMAIFRRWLMRGDWAPSVKKTLIDKGRADGLSVKAATLAAAAAIHAEKVAQRAKEKADRNRRRRACDFRLIDWARGTAAGYLVKYLAKNISGERVGLDLENDKPANETAGRVLAWASCWGIRQFQVVGGPPVGVWRELRRVKEKPEQLELFDAWSATGSKTEERAPDWGKFIEAQGGIDCKRKDRPVQLWKLQEPGRLTKYGDEAGARVAGVTCAGRATATRDTVWTIRRAGDGAAKGKQRGAGVVSAKAVAVPVRGEFRPVALGGVKGTQGGVRHEHASQRPGVLGFGLSSRVAAPRTRVNNCTKRTPGAWPGLAENMAGWAKLGRPDVVMQIFNEVRRLKNGL